MEVSRTGICKHKTDLSGVDTRYADNSKDSDLNRRAESEVLHMM